MKNDESPVKPLTLAEHFEIVFWRLLAREEVDFYEKHPSLSFMFEVVAKNLMADVPGREFVWYDGVVGLEARVRKSHQVEFTGEMWVGDDNNRQWKEDFRARVTDKRSSKQGIWIVLWIGLDRAEGKYQRLLAER